jgi:hypothetical protein
MEIATHLEIFWVSLSYIMSPLSTAEAKISKTETLFRTVRTVYHGFVSNELLEPIVDKIKERFADRAGNKIGAIADMQFAAVQARMSSLADASDELRERAKALSEVLTAYKKVVAEQSALKKRQKELEALLQSRFRELYAAREAKNWSYELSDDLVAHVSEKRPLIEHGIVGKGAAVTDRRYGDNDWEDWKDSDLDEDPEDMENWWDQRTQSDFGDDPAPEPTMDERLCAERAHRVNSLHSSSNAHTISNRVRDLIEFETFPNDRGLLIKKLQ